MSRRFPKSRVVSVAIISGCAILFGTGCIAVSSKNNRFANARQAVVMNDRIYIVNTETGEICEAGTAAADTTTAGEKN
jgi:hypothetical protein